MLSPRKTTVSPSFSSRVFSGAGKSAPFAEAAANRSENSASRRGANLGIDDSLRTGRFDRCGEGSDNGRTSDRAQVSATRLPMSASALQRTSANVPDAAGRFGEYGRRFVPETLMHALEELTREYAKAQADTAFQ